MLENNDIERYKKVVENYNKAVAAETAMQAQLDVIKKQAMEILAKYNCSSMKEIPALQFKLSELEEKIKTDEAAMLKYIAEINAKKEEKDKILLG